jgi:uncharacterized sulfatase
MPDANWPQPARFLASMISRLDATVGQIVERVQRHDLQRDTLILFTSDNGPVKLGADNFGSSGPLRGIKRDMYEGGIRVPFIARWTGRIKPGTSDQVFAFWDLLPTFADLTGQPAPKGLDGISVLPALMGTGTSASSRDRICMGVSRTWVSAGGAVARLEGGSGRIARTG